MTAPKNRMYQEIWERVVKKANAGDNTPVAVKVPNLDDAIFKRLSKAFSKERDLDPVNKPYWRCSVSRGEGSACHLFSCG